MYCTSSIIWFAWNSYWDDRGLPSYGFSGGGDARAMAGGVSKATLPTMAGMVVSLSGIFAMIYISSVSERHTGILEERIKRV